MLVFDEQICKVGQHTNNNCALSQLQTPLRGSTAYPLVRKSWLRSSQHLPRLVDVASSGVIPWPPSAMGLVSCCLIAPVMETIAVLEVFASSMASAFLLRFTSFVFPKRVSVGLALNSSLCSLMKTGERYLRIHGMGGILVGSIAAKDKTRKWAMLEPKWLRTMYQLCVNCIGQIFVLYVG